MIGGIVLSQTFLIQRFQVAVVNLRHVTEHMRQLRAVGVLTVFITVDRHAVEMELVNGKAGNFDVRQRVFQYHRAIAAA